MPDLDKFVESSSDDALLRDSSHMTDVSFGSMADLGQDLCLREANSSRKVSKLIITAKVEIVAALRAPCEAHQLIAIQVNGLFRNLKRLGWRMVILCDLSHFKMAIAACSSQKLAMWVKSGVSHAAFVLAFPIGSKIAVRTSF